MKIEEQYEALKGVAIEVLQEWSGGIYYRPGDKFEATRRYPYPSLRTMIARRMHRCGYSLTRISGCVGISHSTFSLGISKLDDNLANGYDKNIVDLYKAFTKKADALTIPEEPERDTATELLSSILMDADALGHITSDGRQYVEGRFMEAMKSYKVQSVHNQRKRNNPTH